MSGPPAHDDDPASELAELGRAARHDLSELLGAGALHAELLADHLGGVADEHARRHLDALRSSLRSLQTLLDALAEYAWAAVGAFEPCPVDLGEVAHDVAAGLRPHVERGGGRIVVEDLPTVTADVAALRIVLGHLLRNAVDHAGRADVHVRVTAARDAHGWTVTVSDDGCGVPGDRGVDVMRPFAGRRNRQGAERGAGMGLAVSAAAVRRHGGRLWIEDAAAGTRVVFTLPDLADPEAGVRGTPESRRS